jgi:hypothetical protein
MTDDIMPLILKNLLANDLFELNRGEKTAKERQQEKTLLKYLYMLYPGLKTVRPGMRDLKEVIPNITEILSIVDHFCFYNTPPHPEIADGRLTEFRDLLNRAVGELIVDFDNEAFSRPERQLFDEFIAPIRAEKRDNSVTIITTNYDLLIDMEFEEVALKNKVDYGIAYREIKKSKLIFRDPDPLFHYYKLHGSLNWLRCDLCGHYYINQEGSIIWNAFSERIGRNNTCICSDDLRLKSVLVAPSLVRDIRDANLLQIWKASLEAIRTADRLIMIGYSLPPEDLGIRSIIMRALNGRDPKKKLKVDVVQLGDGARSRYSNLFGNDIQYYSNGLKAYLVENKSVLSPG